MNNFPQQSVSSPPRTKLHVRVLVPLALSVTLVSCVMGPDYQRPSMVGSEKYKSATETETKQPELGLDWWCLFRDDDFTKLAQEALANNLDLKAAMARVEQARASAQSVKSGFYPTLTASPSVTRAHTPGSTGESKVNKLDKVASTISGVEGAIGQAITSGENIANAVTTGTGTAAGAGGSQGTSTGSTTANISQTNTQIRVPFDLSYEIDFWGRVRRSYESAKAQVKASQYDLEVVRQTILADLAQNYFNLRSLDARHEIYERNLGLYRDQVDLTDKQRQAGLVNETGVLQAKVQLESTQAQAADIDRQRADLEHAIAILLGRPPAQFTLDARPLDVTPPEIPAGMPGDLLRRRPDVAEAEQNLAAASAEIGVAQANFFPTVTLTGTAGFQSSDLTKLLASQGFAGSFGPNVSLPIFKGGQLKASLRKAKARYDELEATYRKTVLTAFGDVENSLTDLHLRATAAEAQEKAVDDAREYLRLTQIQYETGVTDYLHVIDAEKTLLTNELSEADLAVQRMISTVLLIKAVGGGWESNFEPASDAAEAKG